jgi:hypothetical protein
MITLPYHTRSAMAGVAVITTAICGLAPPAGAGVTKIEIATVESPTFGGKNFGTVGQYERLSGRVSGEVDPNDPLNGVIVDLALAPRNAKGMVGYSLEFQILRPVDRSKGNRRLIYDITNRGRTIALDLFNESRTPNDTTTSGDAGNGFLMNKGFTILDSGWDPTVRGNTSFKSTAPIAKNPDGSAITGLVLDEFVIDTGASPATERLSYPAATPDKSRAQLTVRKNYADEPTVVAAAEWDFADESLNSIKLKAGKFGGPGTFGPTALYEFTYVARDPVVAGLGLAMIRDLATFLRTAQTDEGGTANPLSGNVDYLYTTCSSQPCRAMHDYVLLGFNEADRASVAAGAKRQVFDGILNWKAGGNGLFINYRFSQPVRTHRQHIGRWTPEFQFPFSNHTLTDSVTGKTGGRLARCEASNTCPKIVEANSSNEYWAKAGSMLHTDSKGNDLPGLKDVRYYVLSSTPHGGGAGNGICAQPRNQMRIGASLRAMLVALDAWVSTGQAPPDDRIPSVKDGTFALPLPQAGMGFPTIPGVVYNGVHHTGDLFDFGPGFDRGMLTVLPPKVVGTPYPVFVPKTDADGNDIAGLRLPEVAVPTATLTGWALRADGHDGCDAAGQRIPFAKTKAERMASGDPRLSLEERYADHATYVRLVTEAAQRLREQRFLLEEDAAGYVSAAQAARVP